MKVKTAIRCSLILLGMAFSNFSLAETVWIDVRSALEHQIDSIEGDVRISHSEIVTEVEKLYPDKNTEIKLYCRGGGRAEEAAKALQNDGYTHVESVGGIDDARKYRGINE
ncbi:MAG: rhodanese-like domain-containing protein [Halioglobus sp.]